MKGLFVKDFRLLKEFKIYFIVIAFVTFCLTVSREVNVDNMSLVICYIAMLSAMVPNNMIAYDQENEGMSFIMTLPITAKQYVIEKYIFSIGFIFTGCSLGCVLLFIISRVKGSDIPIVALLCLAGVALLLSIIWMSLLLPLRIKFAEKATVMIFGSVVALIGLGYMFMLVLRKIGVDIQQVATIFDMHFAMFIVAVVIVVGLVLACSMLISINVVRNKEY